MTVLLSPGWPSLAIGTETVSLGTSGPKCDRLRERGDLVPARTGQDDGERGAQVARAGQDDLSRAGGDVGGELAAGELKDRRSAARL